MPALAFHAAALLSLQLSPRWWMEALLSVMESNHRLAAEDDQSPCVPLTS